MLRILLSCLAMVARQVLPVFLCLLPLSLASQQVRAHTAPSIDLAALGSSTDITVLMAALNASGLPVDEPFQVLAYPGWQNVADSPGILKAPRRHATLWLQGLLTNNGTESLTRWLEVSPWRLRQVDAWLIRGHVDIVIDAIQAGLDVPVNKRRIESSRVLLPVTLAPGETVRLLLHIQSDSRPFLTIHPWNPSDFVNETGDRYAFHSVLLAVTLTLVAVLLLQLNLRYTLLGAWMLAMFVFESSKEGYISYLFFDGQWNYASHLRFTSSVLAKALFMAVSVYLLGLEHHPFWRWVAPVSAAITLVYAGLTFVLDGVILRQLASIIHVGYALLWPLMVPAAWRLNRHWQKVLVLLLGLGWVTATIYVFSYILNLNYTAEFAPPRVYVETAVVLGVLLTYARQKRDHERHLEQQLRQQEQVQRERLQQAVEERTRDLNAALEVARKADDARADFLRRVTHDLRSPLTSVLGYAQLLRVEGGRVGQLSAIIHGSATHMLNLVNRLIDYARDVASAEPAPVNVYLYAFLDSIRNEGRILAARQDNRFTLDLGPGLPAVIQCDETFLREILLNLIDNAARHTASGSIILRVQAVIDDAGQIGGIRFDAIDTGDGISPEQIDRLFDPFFRGSTKGEGFGLGLPIVKELVGKLGGTIRLSSRLGEGTSVCVQLPLAPGQEEADRALIGLPAHMLPVLDATGLHAWVVEDVSDIRELLISELESLGFSVKGFDTAEHVLAHLERTRQTPDLVLTDHSLSGASGDSVLLAVRRRSPHVPVMLLSATWHLRHTSGVDGVADYSARLGKPVDLVLLRREVARVCGLPLHSPEAAQTAPSSLPARGGAEAEGFGAQLSVLDQWLEEGATTDIQDWCERQARQFPAYKDDIERVRLLAERGSFLAIRKQLHAWRTGAPDGT